MNKSYQEWLNRARSSLEYLLRADKTSSTAQCYMPFALIFYKNFRVSY
jgi:hypothetical protein